MEPEFDPATLANLREQMGEEFESLVDVFRDESARHLDEIAAGVDSGGREAAHRAAHSLKSSAALFGLPALSALMRELERLPADAPRERWRAGLAQAQALRERGLAWIRAT